MSHTAGLGRSVGALLLWAASALPAAASVDQAQLERALALGQGKGAGSIDVYVGGSLAGSSGPRTKRYDLKSTTKSFGALLLCLALKDGKVALSDPGAKYVADFGQPSTAAARGVTLGQLASHTAGFDKPGGFVPVRYAPGSAFAYSDGGANWLADVLTSAYHQDLAALFRDRIGSRIGAPVGWRSNAYRPPTLDGVPRREFGSGVSADVDAMARVGDALPRGGPLAGCARLLGTTPAGLRGLPIRTPFTPG